uniref:Uncharacterized protein n=1 Tax=Caenorhabditis tropicalis TaxID=1561998 RepID=A0A1I7UGK3_9PELO
MLSISLSKKTFGIKNKTLLRLAAIFHIATYVIISVSIICEGFIVKPVVENDIPNLAKVEESHHSVIFWTFFSIFYLISSPLICGLTGGYILFVDEKLTKKQSIRLACIIILHIIYLFNPWIAKYQKEAEECYNRFHNSIKLYHILLCCCLVMAAFICWLPWQNQSMKKKPKYKVIYGGNDTKEMSNVNDYV